MKTRSSAVLLAVCLSTSMFAAEAASAEGQSGRVVVVNGYRAEAAPAAVRPSILRMPVTALAGGSTVLPVDESYDHLFVAHTDENGNIVIVCTDDHKAAEVTSSSTDTVLRVRPRLNMQRMAAERE
jgi:hypothetical protein